MPESAILVFDKNKTITKHLSHLPTKDYKEWVLFTLGAEQDLVNKVELYLTNQGCQVKKIELQKLIDETAFLLRNPYIHFIYEVGNKQIKGSPLRYWFNYPHSKYSLWWSSLLAEKNTVKSNGFHNLVITYLLLGQIKQQGIKTVFFLLNNRAITDSLKDWGKANSFQFRDLSLKLRLFSKGPLFYYLRAIRSFILYIQRIAMVNLIMYKSYHRRLKDLKDIEHLIITYFPLIDHQAIKKKEFVNRLFQPIQSALKKKKVKFAWGADIVNYDGYKLKESIRLGRNINDWNEALFFWEEVLRLKDLVCIISVFHWISAKYFFLRRKLSKLFIFEQKGIKLNAWPIFKNESDDSFCGSVLMFSLIYYKIFKAIFPRISKETIILYPAEMQGWEKALCAAANQTGRRKTIAVQHAALPMFLLNYFFDKNELDTKDERYLMPRPHRVACVGDIPKRLLMESGWKDNEVFVLGGIRFQHYLDFLQKNIAWSEKKNKVIVTLSINHREAREIISLCLEAFDKDDGIDIIFKGHPCNSVSSVLNSLKIRKLQPPFYISESVLSELLIDAKVIIVTESSAALEGLASYCRVVVPRFVNFLDLNPLSGVSNLATYVDSPQELRQAVKEIVREIVPPYPREVALDFIRRYITFRKEEEFLECIDAQFPISTPHFLSKNIL